MSLKLNLKKWEIALLKSAILQKEQFGFQGASVSTVRKWTSTGLGPEAYAESQAYYNKKQHERELKQMRQHLAYLKRHYYIERATENEKELYSLTSKGRYEVLRLQFILHMQQEKTAKQSDSFYLVIFDIPEDKRKFRNFFRKLLKRNGFNMIQQSVWMTRCNPYPAIDELLKYLKLERYFEIMKVDCNNCSIRLAQKIRRN